MGGGSQKGTQLRRTLITTALITTVVVGVAFVSSEWAFARGLAMARISGWAAFVGLALSLSITPLTRVSALKGLSAWRRSLGVSAAFAAIVHVALSLTGPLEGAWRAVLSWPYLAAGGLAFVVLLLLMVTSFPRVIRLLRVRHWKVLHRAVYAAAGFVVAHLMLSPWGDVTLKCITSVLLLLLVLGRAWLIRSASSST